MLGGRESSPKKPVSSYYHPGSDQYSRPGLREAPVVPTVCVLCLGGTNLITDVSAQQWQSADASAAGGLPRYWQWEKELVLPARTELHCSMQSLGACGAAQPMLVPAHPQRQDWQIWRLLESLEKPFGKWSQQSLCKGEAQQRVSWLLSSSRCWWVSFPSPEEGQHLAEKNKELELHTTQEKDHFRQQVSRLHEARQSHREEMGIGTKASVSLANCQKKERISQRGLCWAEALLCQHGKNGLFWELGNPQLAAGGSNSPRAFVLG